MKKTLFILLLIMTGSSFAEAADLPIKNAGFVPANIWYSKDPFYSGDAIRIYTIIFNGSTYDLTGNVEFLDSGTVIGKTNFSLSGSGRVQDVWVDWKATEGAHTITARLMNVTADGPNGKQSVSLDNSDTGKSERVVAVDPVVTAAKTQAQVQKVADVGTQAMNTAKGVMGTVGESIPVPVKEDVSLGVNAIENFRIGEAAQFQTARENKAKEIDALNAKEKARTTTKTATSTLSSKKTTGVLGTVTSATEKPFAYVMLAVFTFLQYFFQWQILFYVISIYIAYRLVRWGIRRIRNRE